MDFYIKIQKLNHPHVIKLHECAGGGFCSLPWPLDHERKNFTRAKFSNRIVSGAFSSLITSVHARDTVQVTVERIS
jgi:hypothetical protein